MYGLFMDAARQGEGACALVPAVGIDDQRAGQC